jgi:choline kinase
MRGVVLAAGDGGRMRPYTERTPKVLLPLRDRPLIWYPINAMVRAGIQEIGIVVGHQADQIIQALAQWQPRGVHFQFIHNPEFDGGNGVSVRSARQFVGSHEFILSMGDHVIDSDVVHGLVNAGSAPVVLGVDSMASMDGQLSDATKVFVDSHGYITRIGKDLRHWNAVDIGVFKFHHTVFDAFDLLYREHGSSLELTWVMRHLLTQPDGVRTHDVKGLFWSDIDTEEDYYNADQMLEVASSSSF